MLDCLSIMSQNLTIIDSAMISIRAASHGSNPERGVALSTRPSRSSFFASGSGVYCPHGYSSGVMFQPADKNMGCAHLQASAAELAQGIGTNGLYRKQRLAHDTGTRKMNCDSRRAVAARWPDKGRFPCMACLFLTIQPKEKPE